MAVNVATQATVDTPIFHDFPCGATALQIQNIVVKPNRGRKKKSRSGPTRSLPAPIAGI